MQRYPQIARKAWKDYLRGHIVSAHSAKIIANLLVSTCCYSSQTPDHEEPEIDSKNLEKMFALGISLNTLHESLLQMTKARDIVGGGATGQIRKDAQVGCIQADRCWNLQDLQKRHFSRTFTLQGRIDATPEDEDAHDENA